MSPAPQLRCFVTRAVSMAFAAVLVLACKGPSLPSSVTEEPVCAPFDQAGEHMRGGLKQPVRLRVLSGKEVIATVMVYGRSGETAPPTRFLLPDATKEYTVEWTQCPNERAPSPHDPNEKKPARGAAAYICENAEPYATGKHSTKSGEPATHDLALPPPPAADCLMPLGKK
jgi:hypothetical protein